MRVAAIDLFCGAGGLTYGFVAEGISVRAGLDIDQACRFPYEHNTSAHFVESDVAKITGPKLRKYFRDSDYTVLAGCAPCQPFSKYTQGLDKKEDLRWGMLEEFLRLARSLKPHIVTMENVTELSRHGIFNDFVRGLREQKYHVSHVNIDCTDVGLPQTRKRLVLLASRLGPIEFGILEKPAHPRTVREVIGHLPRLRAGEICPTDPLHRTSRLSETNQLRIKASKPGGSWRDWDKKLVAKCHIKKKGKTYPSVYGRMEWDRPSPTITTQAFGFGNGRFGHPEQDRAISLREAALLQSFPANYLFAASGSEISMKHVGRLIGNAVPVELAKHIARSILKHLAQHNGNRT